VSSQPPSAAPSLSHAARVDEAGDRFEDALKGGRRPRIEEYLAEMPEPAQSDLLRELLRLEVEYHRRQGESPAPDEYLRRFPQHATVVQDAFDRVVSPSAHQLGMADSDMPLIITTTEASPVGTLPTGHPQQLGRYRVERLLGQGAIGNVYLAHDDDLGRPVAIKVPNPERVCRPEDAAAYLSEARVLATIAAVSTLRDEPTNGRSCPKVDRLRMIAVITSRLFSFAQNPYWERTIDTTSGMDQSQTAILLVLFDDCR
jgi:hypothetical protein